MQGCCKPSDPVTPQGLSGGHRVQRPYDEILKKVITSNNRTVLYSGLTQTYRMSVVDGLIWVPLWKSNKIVILSPYKSEKVREIALNNISPSSLYQTGGNEIVLASTTGLYVLNLQGGVQYKIGSGGHITDLDVNDKTLVAYNHSDNTVVICEQSTGRWQIKTSFTARGSSTSRHVLNSVLVTNNVIYFCSFGDDIISTFNLTGNYINSFDISSIGPFLSGIDSQGAVLIVDYHHHRLQVLSPDGQFKQYTIQGMKYPCQILIDSTGNLWVLEGSPYNINKYTV